MSTNTLDANALIEHLKLERHPLEGGYFKRTYSAEKFSLRGRPMMSSIYYLLTETHRIGYLHRNASDIMHFHQLGGAIDYFLLDEDLHFSRVTLGADIENGQQLQLLVPAGVWKASILTEQAGHALISEAVCPGFEYSGNELADHTLLESLSPQQRQLLSALLAPGDCASD